MWHQSQFVQNQKFAAHFELEIFADIVDIYPFGYPTEQFLTKLKNDVHDSFVELKE